MVYIASLPFDMSIFFMNLSGLRKTGLLFVDRLCDQNTGISKIGGININGFSFTIKKSAYIITACNIKFFHHFDLLILNKNQPELMGE